MRSTSSRRVDAPLFEADADHAAHCARLGTVVDRLAPSPKQRAALLVGLARTATGLSQDELAAASGLSRSQVARIETGRTRIDPGRAALLASILPVPADLLENL